MSYYRERTKSVDFYEVGDISTSVSKKVSGVWTPWSEPSISDGYPWAHGVEECKDFLSSSGPPYYQNHSLSIKYLGGRPGLLNGTIEKQWSRLNKSRTVFDNWSSYRYADREHPDVLPPLENPTVDWLVTKLLSRFSAASPPLDSALFLYELREFPRMLRDLGRHQAGEVTARDVPGSFLEYSFGWKPLMNDLRSLVDAADSINGHLKLLRKIRRGDKFRASLYNKEQEDESSRSFYSSDVCMMKIHTYRSVECWGTGRFTPRDIDGLDKLINHYATRPKTGWSLLGDIRVSASTIWNSIPWTWLIDYFVNVGDFLEATGGLVYSDLDEVCIMIHSVRNETSTVQWTADGISAQGHKFAFDWKRRIVVGLATPRLQFRPALPPGALAIFGALATAHFLR